MIEDCETTLSTSEDESSEEIDELSLEQKPSSNDSIRRALVNLLKAPNFVRQVALELKLLMPTVKPSTEIDQYVKLKDLKEIVGQLISRNVVGHSLAMMEENNKHLNSTIQHMTDEILILHEKIEKLAFNFRELHEISETEGDEPNDVMVSTSNRLTAGVTNSPWCQTPRQSLKDGKCAKQEKLRIYNELIRKYSNRMEDTDSSELSNSNPSCAWNTVEYPETSIQVADNHTSATDPHVSSATKTDQQINSDRERLAATRRQFKLNMLVYRKSNFSLHLNSCGEKLNFMPFSHTRASKEFP